MLQLSVSLQGVVSVNSFSVDYDKCSDLVVVGLACLQGFRIRVACVRCCEVRFFAKTGVLLRGSENLIAVNIYAVRCSPSQSDDLCLFVEFCREFLALFSILSLVFSPCLFYNNFTESVSICIHRGHTLCARTRRLFLL